MDVQTELKEIEEKISSLNSQLSNIKLTQIALRKELADAKNILDYCIEKQIDPIQAKLSYSSEEIDSELDRALSYKQKLFEAGLDVMSIKKGVRKI